MVEGDCPSMGYGVPYDTSLTNPLVGDNVPLYAGKNTAVAVSQPEPNGVFASTNTSATWVFCIDGNTGNLAPVYVESKVSVYSGRVEVDYDRNRVTRVGDPTVTINVDID